MGKLADLVSFVRRTVSGLIQDEAIVNAGGTGNNLTVQHYAAPGDESVPLPGDQALLLEKGGAGAFGAVGWHDPTTPRKAEPGGKRIYARNAPGTASAELWIEPSGVVHLEIFTTGQTLFVKNAGGPVVVDSPDVRVGDETASQPIARVGDLVTVVVHALSSAPGSPIVPTPPIAPTPTGGVPCAGQIVSGAGRSKAS